MPISPHPFLRSGFCGQDTRAEKIRRYMPLIKSMDPLSGWDQTKSLSIVSMVEFEPFTPAALRNLTGTQTSSPIMGTILFRRRASLTDGRLQNMFTMIDNKSHSIRKRMISSLYSKSYLQSSSDLQKLSHEILFNRFLPIIEASTTENAPLNVLDLNYAASMDFMTAYIFGFPNGSNFLQDLKIRKHFREMYDCRKPYNFWPAELRSLLSLLGRFKTLIVPQWVDYANREIENLFLQMCNAAGSSLSDPERGGNSRSTVAVVYKALSQSLVTPSKSPLTFEHQTLIASEVLDQGAAGHETSGIALTYYMHEISRRPDVQSALHSELLSLSPSFQHPSTTPSLPSSRSIDALPLLNASLMETLRLHAPIPGPQPRLTPSTPTSLANSPPLPAGVRVSASAYGLHRNPTVFPNPEEWRPERWLEGSKESVDEMKRWFWAFGSGGRMCVGSNFAMQRMSHFLCINKQPFSACRSYLHAQIPF